MEVVAKKWLLLGAVVLSSAGAQTSPAIYTIPGTAVQITISSTSADPQYQLTSAEITALLEGLARYPESQLKAVKYVQAQPYGSNPANPSALATLTADGGIILYLPSLTSRQSTPYNFNEVLPIEMSTLAYNGLTPQQQQEWAAIPASITDWFLSFPNWTVDSYSTLSFALQTAHVGQILFMAGVFTNWPTSQAFFYSDTETISGAWVYPPPDQLAVTVSSSVIAFGSSYQFFLQNGKVVAYQIGTASQVNLPTPVPLPSFFASELPISQQFTRAGTTVSIQILQTGGQAGQFTPAETQGLDSILNVLPASHLTGITLIQSEPDAGSPYNGVQGDWTVKGNAITFYLGDYSQRLTAPTPVDAELARAVGFYLYGNVLTSAQKNEYASYLGKSSTVSADQYSFADDYADWVVQSPLGRLVNPPTPIGHRRPPPLGLIDARALARDLFAASFFIDSTGQNISFFKQGSGLTHTMQSGAVVRTAATLTLGQYQFKLASNTVVAIMSSTGAWINLSHPVPIPQTLLAKLPPA